MPSLDFPKYRLVSTVPRTVRNIVYTAKLKKIYWPHKKCKKRKNNLQQKRLIVTTYYVRSAYSFSVRESLHCAVFFPSPMQYSSRRDVCLCGIRTCVIVLSFDFTQRKLLNRKTWLRTDAPVALRDVLGRTRTRLFLINWKSSAVSWYCLLLLLLLLL